MWFVEWLRRQLWRQTASVGKFIYRGPVKIERIDYKIPTGGGIYYRPRFKLMSTGSLPLEFVTEALLMELGEDSNGEFVGWGEISIKLYREE